MILQRFGFRFDALGGSNEVQLWAESEGAVREIADAIVSETARIQQKFSRYNNDGILSTIARAAGKDSTPIDAETALLLEVADHCYRRSKGLFDITSGVLRRAWNFKAAVVPTPDELEELQPLIGWDKVALSNDAVFLPVAGMELDLGGIGKEYAADKAAQIVRNQGIRHGLVNFGGDICVIGAHPDGTPWRIGIAHPRKATAVLRHVELFEGALATSGDYERYFELEGKRYCHILNPSTLFPVEDFQSVSVMSESCVRAGTNATIAMLLGAGEALSFLEQEAAPFLVASQSGIISGGAIRECAPRSESSVSQEDMSV